MAKPTAIEQEMLFYVNRMRTEPAAEYDLLVNSGDSKVDLALNYFNVDLGVLQNQWNSLNAAQPVAWSEQLGDSSQTHSELMIQFDKQSHQLPGEPSLGQRVTNTGYTWNRLAENVFAFAYSPFYGHAGFAIDWGNTSTGIQDPPGHRNAIMNNNYREVGIDATPENNSSTSVGPLVITQHFANRTAINNKGWLVGTAFRDLDGDNFYDVGEGLNNVTIDITGVNGTNFSDTVNSWEAGGYQILLNSGDYNAQFTWDGNVVKNENFTISSENVLINLLIEAGADPTSGKGKIIGNIFDDANADRIWNSGESGISGWTVFLDTNNNQQLDNGEISTTTDSNGEYIFDNLNPGTYNVVEVIPNGWTQTFPDPNNPNGNETYKLDDNESDGWTSYGSQDHLIFNRFEAISGLNTIGSISVGLSSRGNPSKIFIYEDQDNDNQPDGNEKVREVNTNLSGTTGFTTIDITDTQVNGTFFVAALYTGDGINTNWIVRDNDSPQGDSFIALDNAGTLNPNSFSAFTSSSNNWLLRANAVSNNLPQIVEVTADQTVVNVNFGNQNLNTNTNTGSLIEGTPNNDNLVGGAGDDTLRGFAGKDTLDGRAGADLLEGGEGNDRYIVDNVGDVIIDTAGQDTVLSSVSYTLTSSVENLTLTGTTTIDGIGNNSNNKLNGNNQDNLLNGLGGNDNLQGKNGDDTLLGGDGKDLLIGGNGMDVLTGGSGLDSFRFNSPSEGVDIITDFSVVDDRILVSRRKFGGGLVKGGLPANQFIVGSSATTSAQRFFYNSGNGELWYDSDGNGANSAVQIATLDNGLAMTNADIVVI